MKKTIINWVVLVFLSAPVAAKDKAVVNEVVVDERTHLIWQKNHIAEKEHEEAMVYCRDLIYAEKNDWRLPNYDELVSAFWISDRFTGAATYWSSTSHKTNADYKWYVDFKSGDVSLDSSGDDNFVRCVRGGK